MEKTYPMSLESYTLCPCREFICRPQGITWVPMLVHCLGLRALFHGRVAWDAIPDHRREQWAIFSWWVFSVWKRGERDVPAFIDCLLCCVCLLLKARSEEFILSLSVTQTAYLAQLLISLCLILVLTASRLSAQRVWIIVSCCKSMGFLRSPENLFSVIQLFPSVSSVSDESVTSVCGRSVGLCPDNLVLNVIGLLWSPCGISLPPDPLVRTKAPLGTCTGLVGPWQLKMIQRRTGDSQSQLLSRGTASCLQLLFFPSPFPAPLFSVLLVYSLTSVFFPCATFCPRHCLFCLLHHELK